MSEAIYLDYAATAAVRPPAVADAVAAYLRDIGATPGRSGHARALGAGRVALRCRQQLARLFNISGDPGRIAFQFNATHALNTAIHGVLLPGDAVVRTVFDHNAVRRPVAALARAGVQERILPMDLSGAFDRTQLDQLLKGEDRPARLLTLPHGSNVTGVLLPVTEIAAAARERGTLVLLDAAQTAGHAPVDVEALGIDLLAFTGHKGLLGPQGVGGLWVRDGVEVEPLLRGGTGGDSEPAEMPLSYPDHLEAGTLNAPGIAGLSAGLDWIEAEGVEALRERELKLKVQLVQQLQQIPSVEICSPLSDHGLGIVTIRMGGYDPAELAGLLDRRFGIQGRAGLHCAPEAHEVMGTVRTGAFRISLGWATTGEEIGRTLEALRMLAQEKT